MLVSSQQEVVESFLAVRRWEVELQTIAKVQLAVREMPHLTTRARQQLSLDWKHLTKLRASLEYSPLKISAFQIRAQNAQVSQTKSSFPD